MTTAKQKKQDKKVTFPPNFGGTSKNLQNSMGEKKKSTFIYFFGHTAQPAVS